LRSKKHRTKKYFGDDFYTYLIKDDPFSFSEAISSSDASLWEQAIRTEVDSIKKNNTWTLVDLPEGANPITFFRMVNISQNMECETNSCLN